MTPKQKAEELVLEYLKIKRSKMFNGFFNKIIAKESALIAVEQIQKVLYSQKTTLSITSYKTIEDFNHDIRYNDSIRNETILFFDFVKEEIIKL
jgi:hypothetical protein